MPAMIDPRYGLLSSQEALSAHEIQPTPCPNCANLFVLHDDAEGKPRLTFALIRLDTVIAIAMFVLAEPYQGEHCLTLGYAVSEEFRNQGYGKKIVNESIRELTKISRHRISRLYAETIVDAGNTASKRFYEHLT